MYLQKIKREKKGWAGAIFEKISWLSGNPFPNVPHLRGNLFSGRLPHFQGEDGILHTLLAAKPLIENHPSKMCSFWLGNKRILIITKPEDIYYFKIKQKELIQEKIESLDFLHDENHSIITEEGKKWREKRNAYKYHLSPEKIGADIENIVKNYVDYININSESKINIKQLFDDFSFKVNANLLMGLPFVAPNQSSEVEDYKRTLASTMLTATSFFGIKESDVKLIESIEIYFQRIIEKFSLFNSNNLISTIGRININAEEEPLPKDIMADFNILLFAGSEANSFALQSIVYLLATHPEIEKKLCKELQENLKDMPLSLEKVSQLSYLSIVIKETLRLYPPAPFIVPRRMKDALFINGVVLEKEDTILLSPYLTHLLPDVWNEPEKFDPERFKDENKIPKGAYIPFSLGSRACPGEHFALLIIKFFIASIYLNYRVELLEKPSNISLHNSAAFFYKNPPIARFIAYNEEYKLLEKLGL